MSLPQRNRRRPSGGHVNHHCPLTIPKIRPAIPWGNVANWGVSWGSEIPKWTVYLHPFVNDFLFTRNHSMIDYWVGFSTSLQMYGFCCLVYIIYIYIIIIYIYLCTYVFSRNMVHCFGLVFWKHAPCLLRVGWGAWGCVGEATKDDSSFGRKMGEHAGKNGGKGYGF